MTHPAMNSDAAIRWNNMTDTLPPLPSHRHSLNSGAFAPLYTADQMRAYAAAAVAALREELTVTDKLLADRQRVIDAIPECPDHGTNCVPHALEWVRRAITGTEAAVAAERKKILAVLKERLDGTVMSKYISKAECEAARSVLRNAMLDTWGV